MSLRKDVTAITEVRFSNTSLGATDSHRAMLRETFISKAELEHARHFIIAIDKARLPRAQGLPRAQE
jgi:hypothetical protein